MNAFSLPCFVNTSLYRLPQNFCFPPTSSPQTFSFVNTSPHTHIRTPPRSFSLLLFTTKINFSMLFVTFMQSLFATRIIYRNTWNFSNDGFVLVSMDLSLWMCVSDFFFRLLFFVFPLPIFFHYIWIMFSLFSPFISSTIEWIEFDAHQTNILQYT